MPRKRSTSPAATFYRLDEAEVTKATVEALLGPLNAFLTAKRPGHCQRLDYLPRPVMEGLGHALSTDAHLIAGKIVCRVVTDRTSGLKPWETSGGGAVALREDATYGRINVFCAMFPTGLRLAEEDSLNVATFKTDDAESFDAKKCLERHLMRKVNMLPPVESAILKSVLEHTDVKRRPVTRRLRYVLAILGQRQRSGQPVNWESAGAYFYELEMFPDFNLADLSQDARTVQIARNFQSVEIFHDAEKSLSQNIQRLATEAELADEGVRRDLMVYLADKDILKPDAWLPPIAHDPKVRDSLSFDAWSFEKPVTGISLELKPLQDPKKPEKVAKGLTLQNGALVNDGKKPIQIKWSVKPEGSTDLGGFVVTVVRQTQDQGDMDVTPPRYLSAKKRSFMVPLEENFLEEDERCVARIKIQATMSKGGMPVPDAEDESEEFWIEKGKEFEDPPADKGDRLRHLDELMFRTTFATGKVYDVRSQGWDLKRDHVYLRRLNNNQRGDLWLNPLLKQVERTILEEPHTLGILDADLTNRTKGKPEDFKAAATSPAINALASPFYAARKDLFHAIRDLEGGTGVVEIADLHSDELREQVLRYVDRYLELLRTVEEKLTAASGMSAVNTLLADYAAVLRIDTILLTVGAKEGPIEVLLLAPTHPLRLAWLFQYETLLRGWVDSMKGKKPDAIRALIAEDALDRLISLNIPGAISTGRGRVYLNTDSIGLFWGIYPSSMASDLRTSVNAALQVLGGAPGGGAISTMSPRQIADKIERYLAHHPYVQTLKLNVLNPGDGRLVLDAIRSVLEREIFGELNFDLKFFAPKGTRHQLVANAFDDFMAQRTADDWTFGRTISETDERLLRPNQNPLFPKLIYAKHDIEDLLADTEVESRFEAHLTFVIDYFGTTVASREHAGPRGSSALHNLLAEYVTDYDAGKTSATWSRMIAPSRCTDLATDGVTERLHRGQDRLGHLASAIFDGAKDLNKYVTVQLELADTAGKHHLRLIEKVHMLSDWVFTIDRNFGIEYYDDPIRGPGAVGGGYLIDYTPEFLDNVSHRLIISTYHQREIEAILRAGFHKLLMNDRGGFPVMDAAKIAYVLGVLKSVSGKLALKLINNPNQAQEVIGLALTRLALERAGRLAGRVLLPVDSHIAAFSGSPKDLEGSDLTLKRTDLFLVELAEGRLHIDLIEVKNFRYTSPGAIIELQDAIRAKNQSTEEHFRRNFMGAEADKRLDAVIRHKELANILAFYFERARRYGLFDSTSGSEQGDASEQFLSGLQSVAAGGFDVSFSSEGFIFNGSSMGDVEHREVHGTKVHIYGRRGIGGLLSLLLDEDEDDVNAGVEPPTPPNPSGEAPPASPASPEVHRAGGSSENEFVRREGVSDLTDHAQVPIPTPALVEAFKPQDAGKVEAPQQEARSVRVVLGEDVITKQKLWWDPQVQVPKRLLNQHLLIVGKSGSGKSETTKGLIYDLHRQGVPSLIFDFQGEYASGDFFEAVRPQVFDVMDGLPLNPFEIPFDPQSGQKKRPVEMMFSLADSLNSVFSGSGDIQLGKLREAVRECYIQQGFQMQQPAPDDREPPTLDHLSKILEHWAAESGGQVKNLLVRLQPLFESGIFQQGKAKFAFDDLFTKTTVILLTSGIKDLMLAASRFLLEKVYGRMVANGLTKDLQLMVCVDEAHKLCGDEKITDLAKEARKYGLGLILSSQETRDFHPSIFANAGTQIVLALEDADAGTMAKTFDTDPKEQKRIKSIIMGQGSGQALVRSTHAFPFRQVAIKPFGGRVSGA